MQYSVTIHVINPEGEFHENVQTVNSRSPVEAEIKALEQAGVWELPDEFTFMTHHIYNDTKRKYEGIQI